MAVLVFNPGSTTLKASTVYPDGGIKSSQTIETWDLGTAAREILADLDPEVTAIGCRVVHGGREFIEPIRVDSSVIEKIRALGELAPLHNFGAAAVLEACLKLAPQLPVIAVFDTSFHATLPEVARTYALPYELAENEDLYRYGFHGISHQAAGHALTELLQNEGRPALRLVTCHLGGGASLCAILDGKSIDTTMGMTPMEGLVMATRSGDLDPGIMLHLLKKGWKTEDLERTLNQESGLLGVSGISNDPRPIIQAAQEGNQRAALAIELYTYRIAKGIAALAVPLGGIDGISFGGGVGQNSAFIREKVCQQLHFLGVSLDQLANNSGEPISPLRIHATNSNIGIWAIPTHEEGSIAQAVLSFV
ncbi:MAG: acetate/propionate family kinase [bacterium]